MQSLDMPQILLVSIGTMIMAMVVMRAIGSSSVGLASALVDQRRAMEAKRKADNLAAEAAGLDAAREPLALNPDGSIEEPIIGVVETQ